MSARPVRRYNLRINSSWYTNPSQHSILIVLLESRSIQRWLNRAQLPPEYRYLLRFHIVSSQRCVRGAKPAGEYFSNVSSFEQSDIGLCGALLDSTDSKADVPEDRP